MVALGDFPRLYYFRNCKIKNNFLKHFFRSLHAILTGLLPVHTYMQLDPFRLDYDLFLSEWDQIRMYLSPSRIYRIWLPSLARVSNFRRFSTWCLGIKYGSHNTLYVNRYGILSDSLSGADVWLFAFRMKTRWYEGWKYYISLQTYFCLLAPSLEII